ncbi:MAG: hypothetical protein M3Y71_06650 [Actinomycetota bacterium]|nr:hypothetical protein [Actinomycetota bacterium]
MSGYAGTGRLLRLALRRDRVLLPVSGALLVALAGGSASATLGLYSDPGAAVAAAEAIQTSPAVVGMYGPLADPSNPDSIAAFKTLMMGAVIVALFTISLVRRHTRGDEEPGRVELLGSTVMGRRAPLTAAVVLASGAVLVVSLLAGLSMVAAGLGLRGSLAFGAEWATAGLAFVGVTAVAAQVAATARGCAGLASAVLGVSYLLRAVGDTSPSVSWLVWVSPLGWVEKVGVYGPDRFVVLLLGAALAASLVAASYTLLERRDLGAGLFPTRAGPAVGASSLGTPLALAWRLQRGLLVGWVVGYAVLGLVLGAVVGSASSFVTDDSVRAMLQKMGGDAETLADLLVSTELHFMAIGAAAYGIAAALRLRTEEGDLHTEQVLATHATRRAQLGAHALVALGGSALLMVVVGLGLGVSTRGGVRRRGRGRDSPAAGLAGARPRRVGVRRPGPGRVRRAADRRRRRLGPARGLPRAGRSRPALRPSAVAHRPLALRPRHRPPGWGRARDTTAGPRPRRSGPVRRRGGSLPAP